MSNDDVNAVILRLARTLQRCGEDPRVIFSALIGAAATISADFGVDLDRPEDLRRAIDAVIEFGEIREPGEAKATLGASVIPFRPARVA
ncbi:hypothetical protein [Hansschlegelia beijingensis]|uniref:Uncharacterized protein n=1 Tax=Hansschlegelia beijingensis TaxID=1133344 RepID=A0A7W6D286_9HYPH|nr:hypothetical protein [Hansschlegelia beijingensis]MBB3973050.1 hypothetical protein [Hansschlegelia beijingensis]